MVDLMRDSMVDLMRDRDSINSLLNPIKIISLENKMKWNFN